MKRPEFTKEQEYWICDQIGNWYLKWKENIAHYESETHRLGFAKNDLKNMLFSETEEE